MIRKYMKQALPNEGGKPREHPGLFVFNTCTQFIRTMPVLPRDEKKMEDVDTKSEDHIGDDTRYRMWSSGMQVESGRTSGHY